MQQVGLRASIFFQSGSCSPAALDGCFSKGPPTRSSSGQAAVDARWRTGPAQRLPAVDLQGQRALSRVRRPIDQATTWDPDRCPLRRTARARRWPRGMQYVARRDGNLVRFEALIIVHRPCRTCASNLRPRSVSRSAGFASIPIYFSSGRPRAGKRFALLRHRRRALGRPRRHADACPEMQARMTIAILRSPALWPNTKKTPRRTGCQRATAAISATPRMRLQEGRGAPPL